MTDARLHDLPHPPRPAARGSKTAGFTQLSSRFFGPIPQIFELWIEIPPIKESFHWLNNNTQIPNEWNGKSLSMEITTLVHCTTRRCLTKSVSWVVRDPASWLLLLAAGTSSRNLGKSFLRDRKFTRGELRSDNKWRQLRENSTDMSKKVKG